MRVRILSYAIFMIFFTAKFMHKHSLITLDIYVHYIPIREWYNINMNEKLFYKFQYPNCATAYARVTAGYWFRILQRVCFVSCQMPAKQAKLFLFNQKRSPYKRRKKEDKENLWKQNQKEETESASEYSCIHTVQSTTTWTSGYRVIFGCISGVSDLWMHPTSRRVGLGRYVIHCLLQLLCNPHSLYLMDTCFRISLPSYWRMKLHSHLSDVGMRRSSIRSKNMPANMEKNIDLAWICTHKSFKL